jgi:hypothetical protein
MGALSTCVAAGVAVAEALDGVKAGSRSTSAAALAVGIGAAVAVAAAVVGGVAAPVPNLASMLAPAVTEAAGWTVGLAPFPNATTAATTATPISNETIATTTPT